MRQPPVATVAAVCSQLHSHHRHSARSRAPSEATPTAGAVARAKCKIRRANAYEKYVAASCVQRPHVAPPRRYTVIASQNTSISAGKRPQPPATALRLPCAAQGRARERKGKTREVRTCRRLGQGLLRPRRAHCRGGVMARRGSGLGSGARGALIVRERVQQRVDVHVPHTRDAPERRRTTHAAALPAPPPPRQARSECPEETPIPSRAAPAERAHRARGQE